MFNQQLIGLVYSIKILNEKRKTDKPLNYNQIIVIHHPSIHPSSLHKHNRLSLVLLTIIMISSIQLLSSNNRSHAADQEKAVCGGLQLVVLNVNDLVLQEQLQTSPMVHKVKTEAD